MRNPNSEVSGQSLKAQDDLQDSLQDSLKVPKKLKLPVAGNAPAGKTVPKNPQAPKFQNPGGQVSKSEGQTPPRPKPVRQKPVLQEPVTQ